MPVSAALAARTTVLAPADPLAAVPVRITFTVTIAGLYDVLTNTVRAIDTDLTSLARLRLHVADARLHATGTDRCRIHRDWTPLLDNTPAHLPEPLFLTAGDVATLRAVLRRRLAPTRRTAPATLTVGTPNSILRPVRLTVGRTQRDSLTVASNPPDLPYPDITAVAALTPAWGATDVIALNPRYLADAARLTHNGRPVSRHAGLRFQFRTPRTDSASGAVQITHPERTSWTADVMPIHVNR